MEKLILFLLLASFALNIYSTFFKKEKRIKVSPKFLEKMNQAGSVAQPGSVAQLRDKISEIKKVDSEFKENGFNPDKILTSK